MRTVAVLGAGTMGHGIAQACAAAGFQVRIFDPSPEQRSSALDRIAAALAKGIARGKIPADQREPTLARVRVFESLFPTVSSADLVIEAAPEELEIKRAIFAEVDAIAPATTLLASNTSSLAIGRIASATQRPGQVIGLHFFNPVPVMKLVEIVRGPDTTDETVAAASEFARGLGKEPIVVRDTPGFATSRLGVVLGLEAIRMVEQGVASAEDIDKAMELGYNHPMGPLRLTDHVGLDVRLRIAEYLWSELREEQYRPPALLRTMVAEGKLGRKSGRGFYDWSDG
jgi:3-hydroxybutyryl-CoA dehydrogenase